MCYGQKVEQTREDEECWGAAVEGVSGQALRREEEVRENTGPCLGWVCPTKEQQCKAEVCGCVVGAELRVEGDEVRGSRGCGVRWTGLWEALAFSSGRNRESLQGLEPRKDMVVQFLKHLTFGRLGGSVG